MLSSPTSLIHVGSLGAGSLERCLNVENHSVQSDELLDQPLAGYVRGSFPLLIDTQGAMVTSPPGCSLLSLGHLSE